MSKTVAFHSFGCKLNQSETQTLEKGFQQRGYEIVPFKDTADYYVIDTCTVTDQADQKARNIIRKAEKNNPNGRVIVTGCMAQMESERIKKVNPNALVIGTFEKFNMFSILEDVESSNDWEHAVYIDKDYSFNSANTADISSRTRAFLKIQDGCNYVCSFCIIPYARGKDRSSPMKDVIDEAKQLISIGYKEIVLTGVNIGEYKDAEYRIDDLVEEISELDGLKRLRISSIEPNTVTDRLLDIIVERENIMPHVHVPIQSGSSQILEKMRRHYDRKGIESILDRICSKIDQLALGSDFIVGFPQESEQDFQDTISLIEAYPFSYYHTFTFSSRQNTIAARMPDHIDQKTKFERSEYLRKLNQAKKDAYYQKYLGQQFDVLFEKKQDGFTENYIKVNINSAVEANDIRKVELTEYRDQQMFGILV